MKEKVKNKINFKYNLKIYWELVKRYKLVFFGILFFILLVEGLDFGINILLKKFIDESTQFSKGELIKIDFINFLLLSGLLFIIIMIVKTISNFMYNGLINRLETSIIFDLKKKYFNHLIGLSHSFYTTHKTGSLISRLTRGANAIERITDVFVYNLIPLVFQLAIVIGSLIYFSFIPALIVITIVFIFILWSFILQRLQEPSNLESNSIEDIEKANIADIFTNVDSIKYFGKEDYIKQKFSKLAEKTRKSLLKNWDYHKIRSTGQVAILGAGIFSLMFYSAYALINSEISIGTLVFIYTIYLNLLGPLHGFVGGLRGFYRSMADFNDLFEYGKIEKEIKDNSKAQPWNIKQGKIEFKEVEFYYEKRKIFDNFNLSIKPGEKIAVVGHSGSGKSTLIKLLYRFYDVKSGEILIDNKNLKLFKQEKLRSEMAIVPQECVLFDDTIYNNVSFSNPKAKREEVLKAIRFAQLDKIIKEFPNRENTIVGERGVKLSGGEKQRVSIARAILANKKILILDEATSSLDSQTEHEIQIALKKLMNNRTSIIIAHRLSTIMNADRIVVMKKGRIVQIGNHKELIKQKGEYNLLWNMQKGGYIK